MLQLISLKHFFFSKKAVIVTLGTHFYASSVLWRFGIWRFGLWPATCDLWPAKETCRFLNAFSTYPYHQKNFPVVLHECNTGEGVAAALLMSSLTLLFKIMGKNKRSDKLVTINQQFKNWLKCGDLDFRLYKLIMINLVPWVTIIIFLKLCMEMQCLHLYTSDRQMSMHVQMWKSFGWLLNDRSHQCDQS